MTRLPSRLLSPENSLLLVVDIQERLVPVIHQWEQLVERALILIRACDRLGVPVLVSEQYPKGLGHTVQAIKEYLPPGAAVLEKTAFGCGEEPGIMEHLAVQGRSQIMVVGIEAHVCVNQTVHQLLAEEYQVHLMRDAVSSRNPRDAEPAMAKMVQSGAVPGTVEMALFEMMGHARHACFKELQALVK